MFGENWQNRILIVDKINIGYVRVCFLRAPWKYFCQCQQLYLLYILDHALLMSECCKKKNMPRLDSSVNLFCITITTNAQIMAVHSVLPNLLVMSILYPSAHSWQNFKSLYCGSRCLLRITTFAYDDAICTLSKYPLRSRPFFFLFHIKMASTGSPISHNVMAPMRQIR